MHKISIGVVCLEYLVCVAARNSLCTSSKNVETFTIEITIALEVEFWTAELSAQLVGAGPVVQYCGEDAQMQKY